MPIVSESLARELVDTDVPADVSEGRNEDAAIDRLVEGLRSPSADVCAAYAELGAKPGAVGDDSGALSRRNASGGVEPL